MKLSKYAAKTVVHVFLSGTDISDKQKTLYNCLLGTVPEEEKNLEIQWTLVPKHSDI